MADLQSTNRVKLSKVREVSFGVTPANPVFKEQRQTSSSLAVNPQTTVSSEIRSDRQVADLILVGVQAGGDIGHELSFLAFDDDIEEAMQGAWLNKPVIVNASADTEISDVTATTVSVAAGGAAFKTGHLALASGMPTAANNKLARVTSSTGTSVVFPAATFIAETADIPVGAALRVVGFQGAAADLSAVTSGGNALASTALDFTTLGLSAGEWIRIGGAAAGDSFATAANNGWARIGAVAANRLSLDVVPDGWAADTGTGKTVQVFAGDFLVNGSTKRSNTFERQYLDHSPVTFEYLTGQVADQLKLDAKAQSIATYSVTYVGANGETAASRKAGATDVPAPARSVMNTSSNVGRIGFDGGEITGPHYVTSAGFTINNNLRRQNAVGSVGAVGIGNGEFNVTLELETYFGDRSVLQKILDNSLTSFDLRLGRSDGNREKYVFDFPAIKLSSGSPSVSAKNADVMISGQAQAIMHATLGYTMSCGRFWFTPA